MTSAVTRKSGQGLSYGMVSELATYWNVLPGHEDELRAGLVGVPFATVFTALGMPATLVSQSDRLLPTSHVPACRGHRATHPGHESHRRCNDGSPPSAANLPDDG